MEVNRRDLPPWLWPRAAYVHVPFCAHHCGYCDFAVAAGQDHLIDRYLDALFAELRTLGEPQPVDTIFLGGGTPSHLDARQLEHLLQIIYQWLPLSRGHEFSVEANPDSLDEEKIGVLARYGVNRISLGAQSFQPHLLQVLERRHSPQEVPRAVERAKRYIANVSLDLIFGAPGQTPTDWQSDLEQALALEPAHVSTYGLTYEKGTRLWKQRERGELQPVDEETELAFYAHAIDVLEAAGFEQYEISNFARPRRRCRHNDVYWANHAYFGFGVGAARYVMGRRQTNTRDLQGYLKRVLAGESAVFQSEELTPEERARETMALQLRRREGVERIAFQQQTGHDVQELADDALARHVELGLLENDERGFRLTRRGRYVADAVIAALL